MSHFSILPTNKVLFLSPLQLSFDQSRRLRIAVKKRCMTTYLTSVEGYIHTFAAIFGMSRNAFPKERLGGHCVTSQGTAAKETKGYTVDKKRLDNQVVRALAGRSQPACNCHLFPPPTRRLSVGEVTIFTSARKWLKNWQLQKEVYHFGPNQHFECSLFRQYKTDLLASCN